MLKKFIGTFALRGNQDIDILMPGYTHLQVKMLFPKYRKSMNTDNLSNLLMYRFNLFVRERINFFLAD